jgi:polyhydroxyalkanoate synthesis regulator phasin
MWTKRTIAAIAVGGMTVAGVTGVAVAAGSGGQERAQERLQTWVEEGTITQEDADAFERVRDQAQEERQQRQQEREQLREQHMQELADAAGVTPEQLQERLRDGETLSDIAGDNADAVAQLLTERAQERLAEAEANVAEHVEALMNGEGRGLEGFGPGGPRGGHGRGPDAGSPGMGAGLGFGPGGDAETDSDA